MRLAPLQEPEAQLMGFGAISCLQIPAGSHPVVSNLKTVLDKCDCNGSSSGP